MLGKGQPAFTDACFCGAQLFSSHACLFRSRPTQGASPPEALHPPASSPPPCGDPHDGCLNRSPALPVLPVARSPHGSGDGVRVNGSHRDAPGRQTRPGQSPSATCQINVEKPAQKGCNPPPFLLKALPFGHIAPKAGIAQLVEHLICNQGVTGSNPVAGTIPQAHPFVTCDLLVGKRIEWAFRSSLWLRPRFPLIHP